jgi:ribokinase
LARIAVIGSIAQDDVLWLGQPLRDGRHLEARKRKLRLGGGAANTAVPLHHAGHRVALVAPIGADAVGEWLLAKVQSFGLDCAAISRVPGESTRSLVLVDPEGERTIVNLTRCRDVATVERLRGIDADAFYVRSSDAAIGPLLRDRVDRALVVAHVPPLEVGVRPANILVGSESDLPAEFLASPWDAGRGVAGDSLRWVVVTRGARGASAYSASERLDAPAPRVRVVDSTAAGDVFSAGLVHALVGGRPMVEALRTAVAWGTAAVECPGLPEAETVARLA